MHEIVIDIGNGARKYDLTDDEVVDLIVMLANATRRAPARAGRKEPKPAVRQWRGGSGPFGYGSYDDED